MAELIFYKRPVLIDKERHARLKLKPSGLGFAAKTNAVPIVGVEFADVAREFPIVFVKGADGALLPAALLGLREAENLFVKDDGNWDGRYLPAFIRRYPFAPGQAGDAGNVLCIDEEAPGLQEAEGAALFENGEPSALLQNAIVLLRDYQQQAQWTRDFCAQLVALDLFTEANAQANLAAGGSYSLTGMFVINEARLKALTGDTLQELFASGKLGLVYAHLLSLGNVQRLVDKLAQRRS